MFVLINEAMIPIKIKTEIIVVAYLIFTFLKKIMHNGIIANANTAVRFEKIANDKNKNIS